jgi:hypothetical protein
MNLLIFVDIYPLFIPDSPVQIMNALQMTVSYRPKQSRIYRRGVGSGSAALIKRVETESVCHKGEGCNL